MPTNQPESSRADSDDEVEVLDFGQLEASEDGKDMLAFDAYGVPIAIEADDGALLQRLAAVLPPSSHVRDPQPSDHVFKILSRNGGMYALESYGRQIPASIEFEVMLTILDRQVRQRVARLARDRIFVHAGAVGVSGQAIVIPGMSFSGKTTLVHELVRLGAEYYSDEFAVIDQNGLVHPYAKPLSLREGLSAHKTEQPVEEIGGKIGEHPLPVGLIVLTEYRPDVGWTPRQLTRGEATLAVLANTVPAQDRPDEALRAIKHAAEHAVTLMGDRGDAVDVAPRLLEFIQG